MRKTRSLWKVVAVLLLVSAGATTVVGWLEDYFGMSTVFTAAVAIVLVAGLAVVVLQLARTSSSGVMRYWPDDDVRRSRELAGESHVDYPTPDSKVIDMHMFREKYMIEDERRVKPSEIVLDFTIPKSVKMPFVEKGKKHPWKRKRFNNHYNNK